MDPKNPASFNHKTQKLSTGRTYHYVDQIPEGYDPARNATLLLVHGFPDLWYGWRYQIGPWVRQGYRVVVPDMLGYGGSDIPDDPSEYSTKKLCADLAALLDHLQLPKAVIIGHDWGAYTVGRFSLWHPDRLLALVMMSVPYTPPSRQFVPVEMVAKHAPNLGYQVYFANEKSTGDILNNLEKFLPIIFAPPDGKFEFTPVGALEKFLLGGELQEAPCLLDNNEYKYYESAMRKNMTGPLNYYRTGKYRHEEELVGNLPSKLPADLPVLFLWGTKDPTATPFLIGKASKFIPKYTGAPLEGRGHWLMVEAPEETTQTIGKWLDGLNGSKTKL